MEQYLKLAYDVYLNGEHRVDRTGTGTLSVFGRQLRFNLQHGFPLVTTKKIYTKAIFVELLWMLSGKTSGKFMKDNGIRIWNEWMDENDDLGRVYGVQWRNWKRVTDVRNTTIFAQGARIPEPNIVVEMEYIDQLQKAIDTIKNNPTDRRMLVMAWNPGELDEMALPPCHYGFQLYVRHGLYLDIIVNQRSADVFLGLPFDIASYATLVHMIAKLTGLLPGEIIYNLGDTHLYLNHIDQIKEQLFRRPYALPTLEIVGDNIKTIDDFTLDNIQLKGYVAHPSIKGDVSV